MWGKGEDHLGKWDSINMPKNVGRWGILGIHFFGKALVMKSLSGD